MISSDRTSTTVLQDQGRIELGNASRWDEQAKTLKAQGRPGWRQAYARKEWHLVHAVLLGIAPRLARDDRALLVVGPRRKSKHLTREGTSPLVRTEGAFLKLQICLSKLDHLVSCHAAPSRALWLEARDHIDWLSRVFGTGVLERHLDNGMKYIDDDAFGPARLELRFAAESLRRLVREARQERPTLAQLDRLRRAIEAVRGDVNDAVVNDARLVRLFQAVSAHPLRTCDALPHLLTVQAISLAMREERASDAHSGLNRLVAELLVPHQGRKP